MDYLVYIITGLYLFIGLVLGVGIMIVGHREKLALAPLIGLLMIVAWPAFICFYIYDRIRGSVA